jgi:hypothetical protein
MPLNAILPKAFNPLPASCPGPAVKVADVVVYRELAVLELCSLVARDVVDEKKESR